MPLTEKKNPFCMSFFCVWRVNSIGFLVSDSKTWDGDFVLLISSAMFRLWWREKFFCSIYTFNESADALYGTVVCVDSFYMISVTILLWKNTFNVIKTRVRLEMCGVWRVMCLGSAKD
jgi:hypothetical protein